MGKSMRCNTVARKEDKAILEMTNKIGLMTYMALYDVFGFKEKRIRKFYDVMMALKSDWSEDVVPTDAMLRYCEKKKIDVYHRMNSIPTSKKLMLVGKNTVPGVINYLEAGFLVNILMSVIVLKEEFRFTNPQIETYLDKIEYYIDSFTRKQPKTNKFYLNENMILEIFRDELKLDLNTGEKVV